jgi:hypothetical protein
MPAGEAELGLAPLAEDQHEKPGTPTPSASRARPSARSPCSVGGTARREEWAEDEWASATARELGWARTAFPRAAAGIRSGPASTSYTSSSVGAAQV